MLMSHWTEVVRVISHIDIATRARLASRALLLDDGRLLGRAVLRVVRGGGRAGLRRGGRSAELRHLGVAELKVEERKVVADVRGVAGLGDDGDCAHGTREPRSALISRARGASGGALPCCTTHRSATCAPVLLCALPMDETSGPVMSALLSGGSHGPQSELYASYRMPLCSMKALSCSLGCVSPPIPTWYWFWLSATGSVATSSTSCV